MLNFILFFDEAINALKRNVWRSFLTMLGIVIGIAAIVIIFAIGTGAQSLIIHQISSFGSDLIGILPGSSSSTGPPASVMGVTITSLKTTDAEAIIKQIQGVQAVSGYVKGVSTITWQDNSIDSQFTGVTSDYTDIENANLATGRFFIPEEDRTLAMVAVIGWRVYKDLFGTNNPLGQAIKVQRKSFRVIGVVEERGTAFFQDQDDQIFIPLSTAQKKMLGIDHVSFIRVKVRKGQDLGIVSEQIKVLLRERHGIERPEDDDFNVRNIVQALDVLGTVTNVLKYFLAAISALSLLVGGIGIMNIMLVTVLERTREIGLRKAVGAKPRDLRLQFLFETIMISLMGGTAGFLLGTIVAYLVAIAARTLGYYWEFNIGLGSIVLAFIFPVLTGLIFGYYPAEKAARLKPIEALHYE